MITEKDIPRIHNEALEQSKVAVQKFLEDWRKKTGGNQYDEPMYCGFAWVSLHGVKGSTKIGKAFKNVGFDKGYPTGLRLWDPSNYRGQSMDVKEEGSRAYAEVLRKYGFKAYMGSRAD